MKISSIRSRPPIICIASIILMKGLIRLSIDNDKFSIYFLEIHFLKFVGYFLIKSSFDENSLFGTFLS